MKCISCGTAMKTKRENYHYVESGLPHVSLESIDVSRCAGCGESEVAIPAIEDLHRVIAESLIQKRSRLAPAEIRFLRKYLGWSGTDFAKRAGTTPETVSRWETGASPMGGASDRLLRLLVGTKAPVNDYSVDALAEIEVDRSPRPMRLGLTRDRKGGWRPRSGRDFVTA